MQDQHLYLNRESMALFHGLAQGRGHADGQIARDFVRA
jgi:hypothetical protein